MTTTPPIVVLGGGLMGLAIAHQLARRGHSVRVISRNRNEAAGFVAAGMLAPHAEGLSGQLLTLGQRSLALIPQWVAQIEHDSGLTCGLRMSGVVVPFATEDESRRYPTAALVTKPSDLRIFSINWYLAQIITAPRRHLNSRAAARAHTRQDGRVPLAARRD